MMARRGARQNPSPISATRRVRLDHENGNVSPGWGDHDGVTDAGELKRLGEFGIVNLDEREQTLDATTPQRARLTGYGEGTFADGARQRMFDAANDNWISELGAA